MKNIKFGRLVLAEGFSFTNKYPGMEDIFSLDELDNSMDEFDAFIIDGTAPSDLARLAISHIRKNPLSCAKPIFLTSKLSYDIDMLADGVIASLEDARGKASGIISRFYEVNKDALKENPDFRLLAYLYVRPEAEIVPLMMSFVPKVFSYPIVGLMGDETFTEEDWLDILKQRGLLEFGELKNRIRLCPKCETSHLNYIDICPNCGSIAIEKKEFIHCFTCGRVGPVENFLLEDHLRCPFCHTRLRHLGEDYDYPMESYLCNSCGHQFIDADVAVDCLNCSARSWPHELVVKNIYTYRLTNKGKTYSRMGTLEDIYSTVFDNLNYMNPAYFSKLLDWFIQLHKRYSDERFSIIGINLVNLSEITLTLGRARTLKLANEIARVLRDIVRKTDISSRTSVNTFWLLLPRTDKAGAAVLSRRIKDIERLLDDNTDASLQVRIVTFSVPDDLRDMDNAGIIMARLAGEIEE